MKKKRLILISLMVTATAIAQVPRSDPRLPLPEHPTPGAEPPPLREFGRTNIFNGSPGPRFTNPALGRITNGMATNGLFRMTNANGRYTNFFGTNVPGLVRGQGSNHLFRGFTNGAPGIAPAAPTAPNAPAAPEIPTLPGTTPTAPGVPPANPNVPPANPGVPPANPNGAPLFPNEPAPGTPNVGQPATAPSVGAPPVRQPQRPATPVTPIR